MFDKIKQLMELKKQSDKIKSELEAASIEMNDNNGIQIVISGAQKFKSIKIDENLIKASDTSKLEVEVLQSLNRAIHKSQEFAANKMKAVMSGFPGI